MTSNAPPDMLRWYGLDRNSKQEGWTSNNLVDWGGECFSPRLKKELSNLYTRKSRYRVERLFLCCLLIWLRDPSLLAKILFAQWIHSCESSEKQSASIDQGVISFVPHSIEKSGDRKMQQRRNSCNQSRMTTTLGRTEEDLLKGRRKRRGGL